MVDEAEIENKLFSEPMKISTPLACSARPRRSMPRGGSPDRRTPRTRSKSASVWVLQQCAGRGRSACARRARHPTSSQSRRRRACVNSSISPWRSFSRRSIRLRRGHGPAATRALRKFDPSVSAEVGKPTGILSTRFSTWPSSATSTPVRAPARAARIRMLPTSDFAVSTMPAARVSPESSPKLGQHRLERFRLAGPATCTSMALRSFSVRSPICISASTKKRSPFSVGSRPAEVCGA